jgi:nuclear pore complex protein Nup155
LYIKGARNLGLEKLQEICGDFQHLRYAKGAVELPLTCAQVFDPSNLGLESWQAGAATPNPSHVELLDRRMACYDLVLDSLAVFESSNDQSGDADTVRTHAYDLAFQSTDEIFHSRLYDWLISRQLADDLLDVCQYSFLSLCPNTVCRYDQSSSRPI